VVFLCPFLAQARGSKVEGRWVRGVESGEKGSKVVTCGTN